MRELMGHVSLRGGTDLLVWRDEREHCNDDGRNGGKEAGQDGYFMVGSLVMDWLAHCTGRCRKRVFGLDPE